MTILSADNQGSLFETRNNGDTGGFCRNVVWNTLVWRIHQFVKDLMGGFNPVIKLLDVAASATVLRAAVRNRAWIDFLFIYI